MKNNIRRVIITIIIVYSCIFMHEYTKINNQLRLKNQNLEVQVQNLKSENKNLNTQLFKIKNDNKAIKKKLNHDKTNRSNECKKRFIGYFEATAYTDCPTCQGEFVGMTATGRKPQVGIVAVDPNVIPLNTKLYIEGYGFAIAGDTGGAIKGNRLDLFMDSYDECIQFGRKHMKVYIVK